MINKKTLHQKLRVKVNNDSLPIFHYVDVPVSEVVIEPEQQTAEVEIRCNGSWTIE